MSGKLKLQLCHAGENGVGDHEDLLVCFGWDGIYRESHSSHVENAPRPTDMYRGIAICMFSGKLIGPWSWDV
jgi:hypothetical protein